MKILRWNRGKSPRNLLRKRKPKQPPNQRLRKHPKYLQKHLKLLQKHLKLLQKHLKLLQKLPKFLRKHPKLLQKLPKPLRKRLKLRKKTRNNLIPSGPVPDCMGNRVFLFP